MLRAVIERPVSVGVAALALVVVGGFSLAKLPVSLLPTLERPRLTIAFADPERSREELVHQVVAPLERRLLSLDGVLEIATTVDDGFCRLIIESEWQTDVDRLRIDAERRLTGLASAGLEPVVTVEAGDGAPILEVAVLGGESDDARAEFADKVLIPELGRLRGAGRVRRLGGAARRPVVYPHATALAARGLTAADLVERLQEVGDRRALGRWRDGRRVRPLVERRSVDSLNELERLPIGSGPGARLGDVAEVKIEDVRDASVFRFDGTPGVLVELYRAPGANAVLLTRQARRLLSDLGARGRGLRLEIVRDSSLEVVDALSQLAIAGLLGLLLGATVLRWMLGHWRPTLALAVVVPASIVTAFGAFYLGRVSLDVVSLAGLALAAGMLIDNSIVVLEAIEGARARGVRDPEVAGTRQIAMALVASFLTTAVVFLPLIYLRGLARAFFGVQAFAIVAALAVSLALSLSLTPVLARRFGRSQSHPINDRHPGRTAYLRWLDGALAHPRSTLAATLLVLVAGFGVLPSLPRELVPVGGSRVMSLELQWPAGVEPSTAEASLVTLEDSIAASAFGDGGRPRMAAVYRGDDELIAPQSGNPPEDDEAAGTGEITLTFADPEALTGALPGLDEHPVSTPGVASRWRIRRNAIAAAVERGSGDVEVEVSATTEARTRRLAERLAPILAEATGARVETASDPSGAGGRRPSLVVDWNTWRLAQQAATTDNLAAEVRAGLGGFYAGRVDIEGLEPEILVAATLPADLQLLPVRAGRATEAEPDRPRVVPLNAVADVAPQTMRPPLERRNGRPAARLVLEPSEGESLRFDRLEQAVDRLPLAIDESAGLTGQAWEIRRSFRQLKLAMILALVLVFLTVAALYESLALPWVVMATVPVAAAGALTTLRFSGQSLSVMSFLGLILLAGIVVNNAIVLVHRGEQRLAAGAAPIEAIRAAAGERYRPILMTTVTTLLAMIPLALLGGEGVELRRALATAVCGGLITSLFATLLVVPVLYLLARGAATHPRNPHPGPLPPLHTHPSGEGAHSLPVEPQGR